MTYEVQTYTICNGWINTWSEDDQPLTFDTLENAQKALQDYFDELADAVRSGFMVEGWIENSISDYRIKEQTA
jgi:hypothetical protein